MTNPLLYDVKRTLTSKSVLILMAIMILFGFAIIPSFSTGPGPQSSNFANSQILSYYDAGGVYHFLAFSWNQYGQPVSGVSFQVNLSLFQPNIYYGGGPLSTTTTTSSTPVYSSPSTVTNQSGVAVLSITAPINSSYFVSVLATQPNGFNGFISSNQPYIHYGTYNGTGVPPKSAVPPGQVVTAYSEGNFGGTYQLGGFGAISQVTDSSNPSSNDFLINWAGQNGTLPAGYEVYYSFINGTSTNCQNPGPEFVTTNVNPGGPSIPNQGGYPYPAPQVNESNMNFLSQMKTYLQVIPPPKLEANLTCDASLALGLFFPNGTISHSVIFGTSQIYPPPPPPISPNQGNSFVIQFFEGLFGLFIPLLAIVGSFNSYGKDRVSGVLESVLAQPVSRRGLSVSRYLSSFVAMAIAVSVAIAVVDAIAWYFTKSFVSSTIILSSAAAFFVELAVFIGIMMFLSHVFKSSGALIGIGIGIFIVIDFFWGIIIGILANFTNTPYFSTAYVQLVIFAQFINPAQYVSLIDTYLTHQANFVGLSFFNLPITPSDYGVTIPSIVVTGILWVAVPLAAFLYLAIKRD